MSDTPEPPRELTNAAIELDNWFRTQGHDEWEFTSVASRRIVTRLRGELTLAGKSIESWTQRSDAAEAKLARVQREAEDARGKPGLWWANKQAETANERETLRTQLAQRDREAETNNAEYLLNLQSLAESTKAQARLKHELDEKDREAAAMRKALETCVEAIQSATNNAASLHSVVTAKCAEAIALASTALERIAP